MDSKHSKLTSGEWVIFIIIGSAILTTFMISQIKVSVIKTKIIPSVYKEQGS